MELDYWSRTRSSRRRFIASSGVTGAGLATLALAGCGDDNTSPTQSSNSGAAASASATVAPRKGGTLMLNMFADPGSGDEFRSQGGNIDVWPKASVYRGLLSYDPAKPTLPPDSIRGDLAEKWEQPDPLTLIFTLREGVKFHSGVPFTSFDVKANYDWFRNPPPGKTSPFGLSFSKVTDVTAPDARTVRLTFKQPNPGFLINLPALPYGINEGRAAIGGITRLDGTGPMKFKSAQKGVSFDLERNPDYRGGVPYLDGVTWRIVPDTDSAKANFTAGQLNVYYGPGRGPTDLDILKSNLGDKIVTSNTQSTAKGTLHFNINSPKFSDVRIRQAIHTAISRKNINQLIYKGNLTNGGYVYAKGAWALPEAELQKYSGYANGGEANVTEAKALLSAAGVQKLQLKLIGPAAYKTQLELMQQDFAKAGIDMTFELPDSATFSAAYRSVNFDVALQGAGSLSDDPDLVFGDFLQTGGTLNAEGFTDAKIDALYAKQTTILTLQERKAVVQDLERAAMNLYFSPAIWWNSFAFARYATVQNFPMSGVTVWLDPFWQMENTWIAG